MEAEILDNLINEVKRRMIEEGVERIRKSLEKLNLEEVWEKPNANSNSMGNLVLHLCGNVRQYFLAGIDQQKDTRERQKEFDVQEPIPTSELMEKLDSLMEEVIVALDKITYNQLTETRRVQGFNETVLSILVHVTEHFSYHVGQITYYVKLKKNVDMNYYEGMDLNITD